MLCVLRWLRFTKKVRILTICSTRHTAQNSVESKKGVKIANKYVIVVWDRRPFFLLGIVRVDHYTRKVRHLTREYVPRMP